MMKLNWGHKIAIVYGIFMTFMITMLIVSMQYDNELVNEDYYARELLLQGQIDASGNMAAAPFQVELASANGLVEVQFTGLSAKAHPTGDVRLYKPDDATLDESHSLLLDTQNRMTIVPRGLRGRYKVSVRFDIDGKDYYAEKQIVL